MIVGIDGYAGAGKDTAADMLVKVGFTKVSFADALREAVVHSTGLSMDTFLERDVKDRPFKEAYVLNSTVITKFCHYLDYGDKAQAVIDKYSGTELESPRHILQFLGTEVGRKMICETVWIDKYKEKIAGRGLIVTPDARFSNERECIQDLGGQVFWIEREGYGPESKHKSANDKWNLDKYDVIVYNTSMFDLTRGIGLWWSLHGSRM